MDESTSEGRQGDLMQRSGDTSSSSHELPMEPRANVEPGSGEHSVFTHFPKDPYCDGCSKAKITMASCRSRAGSVMPRAENFDDLISADDKILSEVNRKTIIDVPWWYKTWQHSGYNHTRVKTKTSQEAQKNLMKFLEPTREPKVIYTYNSLEFGKCCEDLSWNHCTSTPHRSDTNGIAQRAVRRVKEGTSAVLLQSGLGNERWASTERCCYLRNSQDLLSDGKTQYERGFERPLNGPVIPFGAMVECHLVSATASIWSESLARCVLGYALYAGGIWKGDIVVADIKELEEMDASELHARRLNAKEVLMPMNGRNFTFPIADGTVKIFGRTASENIHLYPRSSRPRRRARRVGVEHCHYLNLGNSCQIICSCTVEISTMLCVVLTVA